MPQKLLKKLRFLFIAIAILFAGEMHSKHIIGGDISYRCLGNGQYRITMKIYRDCSDPTGASFDPEAVIGIFRRENSGAYTLLNGNTILVPLQADIDIEPFNDNPCLTIPDDICVQEGTYVFDISLPVVPQSYFITYQRCCRNVTIDNIRNPGEAGATYTMEISPLAQAECNNSPVFNDFPPIVICAGEDINFDHSASDMESDSLVYSFCSPLLGGGTQGTPENPGDATAINGVAPDPPASPVYPNVQFITPTFSSMNPMSGNPQITIDPMTGLISGVPELIGQYVVGVCVSEFRNGMLISLTRRDFQFNVEDCQPTVVADIREDLKIGDREFLINSCGENIITFENESYQIQNIVGYLWKFDLNGTVDSFTTRDATVVFPGIGEYSGFMVANPGTQCADTAEIFVNVFPEITADFDFTYDTCTAGPVIFTDMSTSGATITDWDWDFRDGNTSTTVSPVHEYRIPGDFPVQLKVTDDNLCADSITKNVNYFPVPSVIIIDPSTFLGCAPEDIFFENLSFPIDSTYFIEWDLGDGTISNEISPTHTYDIPGTYSIGLEIVSPIGCRTSAFYPNWVTVRPSPTAGFTFTPMDPNSIRNQVQFFNQSVNEERLFWRFGNFGSSLLENPELLFPDTGVYEISLVAQHSSGCLDTATAIIDIEPVVTYFLPNAFTPNEDNVNDSFKGKGFLDGATNFNMSIWNRWGEMVFNTENPDEGWNGRKNNTGEYLIPGVYLYVVEFLGPRNDIFKYKGYATLVR